MDRTHLTPVLTTLALALAAPFAAAMGGSTSVPPSFWSEIPKLVYVEPWPQLGRTASRTSASNLAFPTVTSHAIAQISGACNSSPVVGSDGTVYISSEWAPLLAFDRQMKKKWELDLYGDGVSAADGVAPAIVDGLLVVVSELGFVAAIEDHETFATYRYVTASAPQYSKVLGSPAIEWSELHQDWMAYVCTSRPGSSTGNRVVGVSVSSGTVLWQYVVPPGVELVGSTPSVQRIEDPAYTLGNRVVFGDTKSAGFAVQETAAAPGCVLDWVVPWSLGPFDCNSTAAPVIDETVGLAYFSVFAKGLKWDGFLFAVDLATGTVAAKLQVAGNGIHDTVLTSPALDPNGTLYFGTNTGALYAVGTPANGSFPVPNWTSQLSGPIRHAPAYIDGVVALATDGGTGTGYLYAVNTADGSIRGLETHGGGSASAIAISNTWLHPGAQAFVVSNGGVFPMLHRFQ